MKFLVRKEARSPYRKGKIIAAQTEDLKPSPRNKRERKHFQKEILKKTNKYAQRKSPHTPGNEFKSASNHSRTSTKPDRYSPVLHEEKNTNKSSEVYRCSDRQKGAQILPLAHPALHNKIFIPAGYGKARILQILRIDDLFEPCIVQIPIQRPTKNTHTHTHTHTHFFPLIKLPATTKLPEEEEEDLETQKQAPQ
jgi:hypothetical protein